MTTITSTSDQRRARSAHGSRVQFLFNLILFCTKSFSRQSTVGLKMVSGDIVGVRLFPKKDETMLLDGKRDTAVRKHLLGILRAYTEDKGWPWIEPVEIVTVVSTAQIRIWRIRTNAEAPGNAVQLLVSENENELTVVESRYTSK